MPRAELGHEAVHPDAGQRVERAERLVEQQQRGLAHERPGQRGALRLATGEGLGPVARVVGEADLGRAPARRGHGCRVRRSPSTTLSSTFAHGSSRASWNPTARRSGTRISPVTAGSRPARARRNVLLPEPLRPSSATNSPGRMSRSMPRSTVAIAEAARRRRARCTATSSSVSVRTERVAHRPGCHRSSLFSSRRTRVSVMSPSTAYTSRQTTMTSDWKNVCALMIR